MQSYNIVILQIKMSVTHTHDTTGESATTAVEREDALTQKAAMCVFVSPAMYGTESDAYVS